VIAALAIGLTIGGAYAYWYLETHGAPDLPYWAEPSDDRLDGYGGCGGKLDRPPCQTITFGTNEPLEVVFLDIRRQFAERGWKTETIDFLDNPALSATSPDEDVCIFYRSIDRAGFDPMPAHEGWWTSFSGHISVVVDDCSFQG
jgi:hypothetical protein